MTETATLMSESDRRAIRTDISAKTLRGSALSDERRIMVADDDVQSVDAVKTLLESAGYEVSHAYQPGKGMVLARELTPDLILPVILFAGPQGPNRLEISQRHRRDRILKETPVILITGVTKLLGMRLKMEPDDTYMPLSALLDKPFKPDQLLGVIENILGPVA